MASKGCLKKMKTKILTLLGFAAKAGKLSFGFDAAVYSAKHKKAKLIVFSEDISPKSQKEIKYYAERYGIEFTVLNGIDIETVSDAVGKRCGIVSVNDCGFADAILETVQG